MLYNLLRPLLFQLEPETAHSLSFTLATLAQRCGVLPNWARHTPEHPCNAFGLHFKNPVGLAAGLDKDAAHIAALTRFGFGFIEVGTVTPRPQPGNPKPRLFRLPEHQAIINRMGFNNGGLETMLPRLAQARNSPNTQASALLGVNIGKNKDTALADANSDYLRCLHAVAPFADYITINISSPNTPGLRELQHGDARQQLLGALHEARQALTEQLQRPLPLLLKIAPDLSEQDIVDIAHDLQQFAIDGVIATNTTNDRSAVADHRHGQESGGLSGAPLATASSAVITQLRAAMGPHYPIVGVGGIVSGEDAVAKVAAGATMVQLYSGLIYRGPELVQEVATAVSQYITNQRGQ